MLHYLPPVIRRVLVSAPPQEAAHIAVQYARQSLAAAPRAASSTHGQRGALMGALAGALVENPVVGGLAGWMLGRHQDVHEASQERLLLTRVAQGDHIAIASFIQEAKALDARLRQQGQQDPLFETLFNRPFQESRQALTAGQQDPHPLAKIPTTIQLLTH